MPTLPLLSGLLAYQSFDRKCPSREDTCVVLRPCATISGNHSDHLTWMSCPRECTSSTIIRWLCSRKTGPMWDLLVRVVISVAL